jgi:hypothetical protein
MDSNWLVLHEAGNAHANVRCSPRGGERRSQIVVLVSRASLPEDRSAVICWSERTQGLKILILARARIRAIWAPLNRRVHRLDGSVHEQGARKPQDKEVQDDWGLHSPGESRGLVGDTFRANTAD